MRYTLAAGLVLVLAGAGCASKAAPPVPVSPATAAAGEAGRIARIVRLMELNRHRVALEIDRVGMSQRYGENHPDMRRVMMQIAAVDAELKREFLPEEQAAVARYDDRAIELKLQLAEHQSQGRGENHPAVITTKMQLAALENMARAHRRPEAAEAVLLRQVQDAPGSAEPHIELALFYLREGRQADAGRELERALTLLRKQR